MQSASQAYRDSMEYGMYRNNGYIKVSLGVVNQLAQETAVVDSSGLYYFSGGDIFSGESPSQIYATAEQDFSKVDGTMYFAPASGTASSAYYNQGAVSNNLLGNIRITFNGTTDLDIKGFTIDFGDAYPTRFTITTDSVTKTYDNDSRYFKTEDVFNGTSYIRITPQYMVNGQGRFRILSFTCGIANTFTNDEVISYSGKEYVSPISDSLPSMDMSVTIDNQDQYYNPDNPDSALAYMEVGQVMTVQFGYDSDGTGNNIEWLPAQIAHLKSWSATDTDAKFTAVDKFDYLLNGNYYKGSRGSITLYNLAVKVLNDAGITNSSEYFLDSYLKNITVTNPLPNVKYSECLQIIANAGRCCLFIDREDRIHIQSNFMPDATIVATSGEASYSHVSNVLETGDKAGYANASQDYSVVDGSLYFLPTNSNYLETGFISSQVSSGTGAFSTDVKLQIYFETETPFYGMRIKFRNTAPKSFLIYMYDSNDTLAELIAARNNNSLIWETTQYVPAVSWMVIQNFTGYPNSRLFIDEITFDNTTDYTIQRANLSGSPTATRQNRIQSIAVMRHTYSNSTEALKSLKSETITKASGERVSKIIEFNNPSYGYSVSVSSSSGGGYSIGLEESGPYYAKLYVSGAATMVQYEIKGYEYVVTDSDTTNTYHASGDIITWNNPLVSEVSMAQDIADWLGDYYLGDVTYQIPWRGDPRIDANDLFWLELKKDNLSLIRAYQNEMSFNGGWSGTLQARNYKNTYKAKPVPIEANGVLLTFADPSITEAANWDYIRFYYKDDDGSYKYTANIGGTISGRQIFIPSFEFYIYWYTDGSVTRSGWGVESVVAVNQDVTDTEFTNTTSSLPLSVTETITGTAVMPSAYNYGNNERKMWLWDLSGFKGKTV